jgi:RNA-binding protein
MGKSKDNKQFRAIGHKLQPVVTIAGKGLSEGVMLELERALSDHELIKIKLVVGDRPTRNSLIEEICERCNAQLIQSLGHTALLLRRSAEPDPKLSNLIRA